MTKNVKFTVDPRQLVGKKVQSLRQAGLVPGVIYGKGHEPINIQVKQLDLERVLDQVGFSTPLTLKVDKKDYFSIVKNFDRDPVKRTILNVEFQTISADEAIDAAVELVLVGRGESPAEKAGFTVMQVLEDVELRALPNKMPSEIEIKLDELKEVGDHITLGDLNLPEGVDFTDKEVDLTAAVVNVYDPAQLEAHNEAAAGEAEDVSDVESENGSEDSEEAAAEGEAESKLSNKA